MNVSQETGWVVHQRDARQTPTNDPYYGRLLVPAMLLWVDPPYGTGKTFSKAGASYKDGVDTQPTIDALNSWLPYMDDNGTVVVCCDYRLAPQMADQLDWCYRGEVVWGFGMGKPRTSWWPVRHNNLLTFTRTPTSGVFHHEAVPRVPRLSSQTARKAGKVYEYPADKPAGSIWDYTFSGTDSRRVGYPTEKPTEIITPFILAHTEPGDVVVDCYMGSGSTGEAALRAGRSFYGCDISSDAVRIATERLEAVSQETNTYFKVTCHDDASWKGNVG